MSLRRAPVAGGTWAARNRGQSHIRGAARNTPGRRPGLAARDPPPALTAATDVEVGIGQGGGWRRPPGARGLCGPRSRPRHPDGQGPPTCSSTVPLPGRGRRPPGGTWRAAAAAPGPPGSFRDGSRRTLLGGKVRFGTGRSGGCGLRGPRLPAGSACAPRCPAAPGLAWWGLILLRGGGRGPGGREMTSETVGGVTRFR